MVDRRTFLTTLGAAALAAKTALAASIKPIGVQLYTVRTDLEKDFDGTLAKIAAIGYAEVEFAGYFDHTPAQVRDTLKKHRLVSPSAHIAYDSLTGDKWNATIDAAHTIGHTYLVNAWVEEPVRNEPGAWSRIAEVYNRAGEVARRANIQFIYHNHNFEFAPRKDEGDKLPYDVLLEKCDPALVKMELDLCWITAAGKDPVDYFNRYPGRFPMVHIKGLRKQPPVTGEAVPLDRILPDVTEVGRDDIVDWKRIFAGAGQAGIKHYFVEHDQPKEPFESLKTSYDYVSHLQF